jgi:hypothetical protein
MKTKLAQAIHILFWTILRGEFLARVYFAAGTRLGVNVNNKKIVNTLIKIGAQLALRARLQLLLSLSVFLKILLIAKHPVKNKSPLCDLDALLLKIPPRPPPTHRRLHTLRVIARFLSFCEMH